VAEPLDKAREEVSVVPSTRMVKVPVGVVVTELEPEATVIVTVSVAPAAGVVVVAEKETVEASSADEVVVGHASNKL
jgi:hypothetical protein